MEDIPELVRHFVALFAAEESKSVRGISDKALALLQRHRWPGNVRQLENAIFRAVVLTDGEEIGIDEFPQVAAQLAQDGGMPPALAEPSPAMAADWPAADEKPARSTALTMDGPALRLTDMRGEVRPLDEIEREVLRFAISHYRGQMSEVARRLQIGRSTLYRKLEGLDGPDHRAEAPESATAS